MNQNIKNAKQAILNAIEIIVENKIKNLPFDRTYTGTVQSIRKSSSDNYKCTVIIGSAAYDINTKINYSIGDKVRVKAPGNDWSNIYIEEDFFKYISQN